MSHWHTPMNLLRLWQTIYWIWVAGEVLAIMITRTRRRSGETRDRGSFLVLWAVIFSSIWFAFSWGATHPHTMFAGATPAVQRLRFPVALAFLVLGIAVRMVAILSLGRSFSVNVAVHATQTIYRRGLYRFVRHPSYTGLLLIFASIGVVTGNWVSLLIVIVLPTMALLYRIRVEERALLEAFGPQYAEYSRTTARLIPGLY